MNGPVVTEDEPASNETDRVWTMALGFASGLALYGRMENDEKARRVVESVAVPLSEPEA